MIWEALIVLLERLWPLWLLLSLLVMWRLWFLRAKGEGDPESTAAERRRWKRGLIVLGTLFVVSFAIAVLQGRPQPGEYHPAELEKDGEVKPAELQDRP